MSDLAEWQRAETRAAVVLEEVFCWLEGKDLARAGATCRLWHEVAAIPALWRRLVLRDEVDARAHGPQHCHWREQYVCAHAPWERSKRINLGVVALHGALSAADERLALAAADASVSVWKPEADRWVEVWRCEMRESCGWASVARVVWAPGALGTPGGRRLLAAGPLALAEHGSSWELLVLQFDERGTGHIASRARCGAGAAGCWVDAAGDAFLSLEPLMLAPGLAVTSVWLNAATQETQSEHAGVASRLFRIYNEGGEHMSHVIVVEPPSDAELERCDPSHRESIMVTAWGQTLGSWSLGRSRPEPVEVHAGGFLIDRVRVMRERALLPDPEPADLDEATVRAQCVAPLATTSLRAAPIGLVLLDYPGEPRLWISTSDGAIAGFSTPNLIPLRVFTLPATTTPLTLHYVQPAISEYHIARLKSGTAALAASARVVVGLIILIFSVEQARRRNNNSHNPQGSLSGNVCVWALRGAGPRLMRSLSHGSSASVALLPRGVPPTLLVFAGDELHIWRSRATTQSSPASRTPWRWTRNIPSTF